MPVNAGRLDRRITIQSLATTRGTSGGVAKTYTDEATIWAEKVETTGREFRAAGSLRAETTIAFRIRYRSSLTEQHRIYFGGKYYDILQINEEGRQESQLIQARTVEAVAA